MKRKDLARRFHQKEVKMMQKLLPPKLFWISGFTIYCFWWFLPEQQYLTYPLTLIGIIPLLLGVAMAVAGSNKFERLKTNIKTFDEPDILVNDGLFRISRNPMYLGFVLALSGVLLLLPSLPGVFVVLTFFIITDRWYIQFEEKMMTYKFGQAYQDYKRSTRRWI
jgi:protein-S-isoprenylcysteine O-methyltransferase Ste14